MDLEISDLEFGYRDRTILKGLCLDAHHGQVVGILGENGCGKTILLKCIDSLLKPSGGTVLVSDIGEGVLDPGSKASNGDGTAAVDRMGPKELARSMALVAQSAYVTFPFSVIDMVSMGRYSRTSSGPSEDDMAVVRRSLEKAGAIQLAGRNVTELSGGEFRRVMIARALAQEPDILLLDEPTLHLDVCHQFDLMDTVRDLADSMDMTVVIVTHDMVLAARYCDRIILMEHGEIIAEGPTVDVITEENMRKVFHMDTEIRYDERIGGLNVTLLRRHREDPARRCGRAYRNSGEPTSRISAPDRSARSAVVDDSRYMDTCRQHRPGCQMASRSERVPHLRRFWIMHHREGLAAVFVHRVYIHKTSNFTWQFERLNTDS